MMAGFRKLWLPEIPCFTVPARPFKNLTAAAAWSQYFEESGLKNAQSLNMKEVAIAIQEFMSPILSVIHGSHLFSTDMKCTQYCRQGSNKM
jgi:hypothetical protein